MKAIRVLPLAGLLVLVLLGQGAAQADGPFTPTYSLTLDEVAPDNPDLLPADDDCPVGVPCKTLYSLDIPDGQPMAGVLVRHPWPRQELGRDVLVPDGAVVGHFEWSTRVGPWGSCASGSVITSQGDNLDATTDPNTTTGSPADLSSFSHWPTQLDGPRNEFFAAFPDAVLIARSVGSSATVVANTLVYQLANGDMFYQPVVGDPTVPPAEESCGPVTIRSVGLGLSVDNPDTPQDEGGIPLGTCVEAGVVTFTTLLDRGDTPPGDWVPYDDTAICSPNTPTGSGVPVPLNGGTSVLAGIDVTFSEVASGGSTTVITTTTGPPPPTGFKIVGLAALPLYFDINTDTSYSGDVTICVRYDETQVAGPEANLRLMQRVDGFVDITTSVDTVNDIICGTTTGFSIFVVVQPTPAVGGIVDLRGGPADLSAQQSGTAAPPYVALAGAVAAAAIAIAAGTWYARRRKVT